MPLLYKMVLKLAFKTAFPYGFSAFFIDTRLVNRAGTASLVRSASAPPPLRLRSAAAEAEHSASFFPRTPDQLP